MLTNLGSATMGGDPALGIQQLQQAVDIREEAVRGGSREGWRGAAGCVAALLLGWPYTLHAEPYTLNPTR